MPLSYNIHFVQLLFPFQYDMVIQIIKTIKRFLNHLATDNQTKMNRLRTVAVSPCIHIAVMLRMETVASHTSCVRCVLPEDTTWGTSDHSDQNLILNSQEVSR